MSVSQSLLGSELIEGWQTVDEHIVDWILKLAEFDADQLWALDGFANCISWLEIKCQMPRSTAYEKVMLLTRLEGLDDERDTKFVTDAGEMSTRAVAARVRNWNYYNGRENSPDLDDHYGMFRRPGFLDGLGQLVIEAPNDEIDRIIALADAYNDWLFHNQEPTTLGLRRSEPVDKSSVWTEGPRATGAKRLHALLDLMEEIAPVTDTAAPSPAATAASPKSTTSTGGRTAAKRTSTTACHSAPTTTTSSTTPAGTSPGTPTPE